MRKGTFVLGLAGGLVALAMTAGIAAARAPTASITLACDRGVSATVAAQLAADADGATPIGDPVTLACSPTDRRDTARVPDASDARFLILTSFEVTVEGVSTNCSGGGELVYRQRCPFNGTGATLSAH